MDLALKLSKITNSHFDTASSLWNLAYYEANQNNFELALKHCDEAHFYIMKKNNKGEYLNKFGLGLIYYYKGTTYPKLKQNDFAASKFINFRFGYDKLFIGNGYRSLLLSDFSNNFLYLQMDVQLKKFAYKTVIAEMIAPFIMRISV